jgi:hypothetical protein
MGTMARKSKDTKEYEYEEETDDETDDDDEQPGSDLVSISGNVLSNINYKLFLFVLVLGIIIFSDTFMYTILSKVDDTVDGECTTTKGTMVQILTLTTGMLLLDLLIKYEWL